MLSVVGFLFKGEVMEIIDKLNSQKSTEAGYDLAVRFVVFLMLEGKGNG